MLRPHEALGRRQEQLEAAQRPSTVNKFGESLTITAVALILTVLVGCSSPPGWGPLAVVARTGDDARTEGTLRITEECVFIDSGGETSLLVWPADRTVWDPALRTVSFTRPTGEVIALRSGQVVALGGGSSTKARDGEVDWIAPPAPECLTDARWFVSDVL